MRRFIAFAGVVAIGVALLAVWGVARGGGGSESGTAAEIQPDVLLQLGPNTTYHRVERLYRRYGTGDAAPPKDGAYLPEWTETEMWATFDSEGGLAAFRSETRGLDGTLYARSELIDRDLIYQDADGTETRRFEGFGGSVTATSLQATYTEAVDAAAEAIAEPGVRSEMLGGAAVWVVEDRRPKESRPETNDSVTVTGYRIPHIADLDPVEEIRRQYILQAENRGVKSEVVIVSGDGTETVVESRERILLEVIQGP